jgi:DNA-binding CsgD family transcriptional regulator
MKVESLI